VQIPKWPKDTNDLTVFRALGFAHVKTVLKHVGEIDLRSDSCLFKQREAVALLVPWIEKNKHWLAMLTKLFHRTLNPKETISLSTTLSFSLLYTNSLTLFFIYL